MATLEDVNPDDSLWAWLAHDLRFYRLKNNLNGPAMGRLINVTRGHVNNLERGIRVLADDQARILDQEWRTGGHFLRLLTFARLGHDPDWFKEHVQLEAKADVLRIFELALVPGILQTEEYVRALFTTAKASDIESHVAARLARQEVLRRPNPPQVWILLDEGVIDRPIGSPKIMHAQLAHLLEASELPHVSLRVIPRSFGAHVGLDGGFKIMTVNGVDMAYTDANGGGRLARGAQDVRSFVERFGEIGEDALPRASTRLLIVRAMEAFA